ncbi:MAG: LamG-like jellyroll fold domain-containing protein, partial [Planctomycetaceae bacterium]
MADSFDPWHVWLGVSPQQQPPNHYRLLGMTLFEHNEDVIDTAASRQSAALREQSSGKHVDQAEQVLAQIATARACLLHRKHRTRYDQQLRDELNRRGVVIPAAVKIPEAEPGYHLWLGIPPAQQPPNHYCLLGIETFEESSEVIEAGAARQTVYLREVSTGPHRKLSQQLLNNVAAARRCLLETDRKRQYDEELKRGTAQAAEAGMVQAESAPAPAITTVADILADPEQRGMSAETESAPVSIAPPAGLTAKPQRPTHGSLSPEKRKSAILIGVVSCLGLLLLLAGWIRGPGTPPDGDQVAGTRPESSRETGHVPQDGTGESDAALAIQPNVSSTGLNGLLGHWSFDEKNSAWAQNSVTPLPVVLHGQPEFTAGPLGSAVQCLGPQQFLELPAGVLDSDAGTIAFWMRRGKQTETGNGIQLVSTTGQGAKLDLRVTDGGQIQCSLGARSQPVDVSVGLTPEVWFHLALTWDRDDGATLYCNAKQIGAAERIGQVGLPIGVRMGATRPDVSFDDVRCFNRALQEQDLRPLIETVSIALQAPETLSSATGETVAAIDRTSAGTMPGERSTDVPVASKSEQSKNRPGDSRKNKARRPRIPQAPAARKVIFPEAASHAVSQVWKNLAPVSLDGLIAATGENRKSQWRTLPALAAV